MNKPTLKNCRTLNRSSCNELSLIVEIFPFGLIPKLSDMRKHVVNKVEIKLTADTAIQWRLMIIL